jgi:hypothetical protein
MAKAREPRLAPLTPLPGLSANARRKTMPTGPTFSERDDAGPGAGERNGGLCPFFSSTSLPCAPRRSLWARWLFCSPRWWPRCPTPDRSASRHCWASWPWGWSTGFARAAERDAALCRADRRHAVQLLAGQSARPGSAIQTPLMGDLFQLMGTLVVIGAGLDRILLASMVRSFRVFPLGSYALAPVTALASCAPPAASFWPRSSWPRRCWRQPCWSRWPWPCWASSVRSCR